MTRMMRAAGAVMLSAVMTLVFTGVGVTAPAPPRSISDEEYFSVAITAVDEDGVGVPVRNGDATLGFAKACWRHNFCNLRAMNQAISGSGNKQAPEGPRVVYRAHAVGGGWDFELRVVVDTSRSSQRGFVPDGGSVGVITAYCVGMTRCPDALNEA